MTRPAHRGNGEHPLGSIPDCPGCADWRTRRRHPRPYTVNPLRLAIVTALSALAAALGWALGNAT